jgi:hypothetical protein
MLKLPRFRFGANSFSASPAPTVFLELEPMPSALLIRPSRQALTALGLALVLLAWTTAATPHSGLFGQEGEPDSGQREFRNASGKALATGTLLEVEGNKVKIATVNGTAELRLSELSAEDKTWIRESLKRKKLEQEADLVRVELLEANTTGKPHLVYKVLRKLRPYGSNAQLSGPLLLELLKKDYLDLKTRQEVLLTYVDTAPLDAFNAEQVLAVVAREWSTCAPLVSSDPVEFLKTYARFGDWSTDYLTNVAYTGEIKPNPEATPPPSPRNTDLVDETLTRNRAAAARGLAELKSERSLEIILEILALVESPSPKKSDLDAQKVCLEALGANGLTNDSVAAALARLEKVHPELVARVREKLAAKSDQ